MSAVKPLVKEITNYLGALNTTQQKAVLAVVKTFAQKENDWDDKKYLTKMNRRFAELENGKVKSISLDDLETHAHKNYKNRKK